MSMLTQRAETAVAEVEETETLTTSEAVALVVVAQEADSEETGTVVSAVTGTEVSAEETVTVALEERPTLRPSATVLLRIKNQLRETNTRRCREKYKFMSVFYLTTMRTRTIIS